MRAILRTISYALQPVTSRHQLDAAVDDVSVGDDLSPTEMERAQLVTDRYQFQSVTNCNQLKWLWAKAAVAIVTCTLLNACQTPAPAEATAPPREIHTADYDLIIPAEQKALLILFPCFSCDAADTRTDSKITAEAAANGITVMLMNFNRHIMMSDAEQETVIGTIEEAVRSNELSEIGRASCRERV